MTIKKGKNSESFLVKEFTRAFIAEYNKDYENIKAHGDVAVIEFLTKIAIKNKCKVDHMSLAKILLDATIVHRNNPDTSGSRFSGPDEELLLTCKIEGLFIRYVKAEYYLHSNTLSDDEKSLASAKFVERKERIEIYYE